MITQTVADHVWLSILTRLWRSVGRAKLMASVNFGREHFPNPGTRTDGGRQGKERTLCLCLGSNPRRPATSGRAGTAQTTAALRGAAKNRSGNRTVRPWSRHSWSRSSNATVSTEKRKVAAMASAFLQLFSSHFSRTLITDLLPNRCEDTSTVNHRELRQSPETIAFPATNFSPLFDNRWPRSAQPQVHAKQRKLTLSPIV